MARNVASVIENNFVNGVISEATALNFPESAATEADNCVFQEKGNVVRRYGFDLELGYATKAIAKSDKVINTYLWQGAAGDGGNNFVVLQVGGTLYFYKVGTTGSLSSGAQTPTISLSSYKPTGAPDPDNVECQFTSGYGYLFVTHPTLEPFYVVYDPTAETFTGNQVDIKIRDFDGLEESGVEVDERPTRTSGGTEATMTKEHHYNLLNQGWTAAAIDAWEAAANVATVWPANNEVWWLYKNSSEVIDSGNFTNNSVDRGNTPAPKGHFILDAFNQDRSTVSGVAGISVDSSGYQRPQTCAFFAARVFWAGVASQGFSNKVYYSKVVTNDRAFGQCHQTNDPTSETLFDLLSDDGGVIPILDCGSIIRLWSISGSLLVFASNGVWSISGSTGTGFTAQDFSVRKLSSVPCLSAASFVDVSGYPAWWNTDGIYVVAAADQLGQISITSLSEKKIKTFYNDSIPTESKRWSKGYFNSLTRVVHWLYSSTEPDTTDQRYEFDRVLALNTVTGAFYTYSISAGAKVNGLVAIQGTGSTGAVTRNVASVFKYLVSYDLSSTNVFSFAETRNTSYLDWETLLGTGVDYSSYLISGYKVHGDAQKKFQANYIYVFTEQALNGALTSVYLQALWDYARDGDTGRWSSKQLIQYEDSRYASRAKRLKLRGHGLAVQFKFESLSGQPFNIIGWSVMETGNTSV